MMQLADLGAGMALMFLLSAATCIAVCLGAYLVPAVRIVEHDLPDCDRVRVQAPAVYRAPAQGSTWSPDQNPLC